MAIQPTPLMKQYAEMKQKHPDAVLLFRVSDFYETFSEDAIIASEILGITLSRRGNGSNRFIEIAGFPHHALDIYLPKLVRAGKRVAICEQLEDPKQAHPKVKKMLAKANPFLLDRKYDYSLMISCLTAFNEAINKIATCEEIKQKAMELKHLASSIGITNMELVNTYFKEKYYQPSLFD